MLREARASLNRLLVALPQGSVAARKALFVIDSLEAAVEELCVWPPSERDDAQTSATTHRAGPRKTSRTTRLIATKNRSSKR